ncbi:menaquinone biosynthetic enzyme MqnA/MqnD family protein [Desulfospira joergensenii]|uniref:menaquinone biosynthetic enzyme MqnA/MqnD family protein n=1 Tax=Desulfospira joergensenii TaxID=53329 RepID=UPI0003B3AA5F|nr:menaquinone biosynthesis protein [Desulfospira joergensenii]
MNSDKLRMGRISYINASPVYYGLDRGLAPDWLTLVTDVPAALNHQIRTGEVDISPISAAFYGMNTEDLLLIPDFSISSHREVMSVICASNSSLEELTGKKVLFSRESATGASLLKMIFAMKRIEPELMVGPTNDINRIPEDVEAVMVIGDAALTQPWEDRFSQKIDLGQSWFEMTGLPFVFAVWAVRRSFAREHPDRVKQAVEILCRSREQGYEHIDEVVDRGCSKLGLSRAMLENYYHLLHCDLDRPKIEGMKKFFGLLYEHGILRQPARVEFFQ